MIGAADGVAEGPVAGIDGAERRAIVLGITTDLAFAAGALVAGLRRHGLAPATTVVIFHDGLDDTAQAAFRTLWPTVTFRPYDRARMIARLGPGSGAGKPGRMLDRVQPMIMAKLELPDLLDDFDRCVWLDADMLVQGPVGGLWDFGAMAWRPLPEGATQRREGVLAAMADLLRQPALPLLNGGAVGVARALRDLHGGTSDDAYAIARSLLDRTDTQTPDEMSLYLLANSRGVPVTLWPMALNHPVQAPGSATATVLHAIGPHKFWNATPLIQLFPAWAAHQADWVAAGGAPYAGPVLLQAVHPLDPGEVLRAAVRRAEWLDLYDRLRPDLPAGLQVDPRLDGRQMTLTLAGQPADRQVRLVQHPNPRRIGLELALDRDQARAALAAIRLAVPDLRETPSLSVPLATLAAALHAVAGAVGR